MDVIDSFDISHNNRTFSTRIIQVSESSGMTVVLGLRPASKYQVSVSAKSKNGNGPPVQVELVSKELNHLAAILHVYSGDLNFMK